MIDLDLGMNNWMSDGFKYPEKPINRGKLLTPEMLKKLGEWGRYKDVDGDGIPVPHGAGRRHAGVLHARLGPQREGPVQRAARRLRREHGPAGAQVRDGARSTCRKPVVEHDRRARRSASSATARRTGRSRESRDQLREETDVKTSYFRLRAYPFTDELAAFIDAHERVYVIEQNRDAQLLPADAPRARRPSGIAKLRSVLHYNGLPIDARSITDDVLAQEGFEVAKKTAASERRIGGRRIELTKCSRLQIDNCELDRTYINGDTSQSQSHRARTSGLQGRQDDAVRRLRPQRHLRAHHRRVLRDGRRSRARSSSCRASAARARARRTSWAARTASTPSTAACRRSAPARCWPTSKLIAIGVSGDGDTGAIGIGQFVHLMRRNLPIIYIIEDNGCYGLTKGQFSPTADLGSKLKTGVVNDLPPIDTCALADRARRHVRGAVVLRRQEAAARRSSRRRSRTAAP